MPSTDPELDAIRLKLLELLEGYSADLDPATAAPVVRVLRLEAARWCVEEAFRRFARWPMSRLTFTPLPDATDLDPGAMLWEIDNAWHDAYEVLQLVTYVLQLHEECAEEIGPLHSATVANLRWVVERETRGFQESIEGQYARRRQALGIPREA